MCDETTTQTTEIPITPEEKALQDTMMYELLPVFMKEQGYDLSFEQVTAPKNPEKIASLQSQIDAIQTQMAGTKNNDMLVALQKQLNNLNSQLITEQSNVETKIQPDMKLNEYGQKIQAQKEKEFGYQQEITDAFMTTTKKFLNGDFALDEKQAKYVQDLYAPIKDTAFKLLDEVKAAQEKTGADMTTELKKYSDMIDQTGVSIGAALNAVNDQIENTKSGILTGITEEEKKISDMGQNVKAALMNVGSQIQKGGDDAKQALEQLYVIKQTMIDKKLENLYVDQQKQTAMKAAQLGRSPMDPQFQLEFLNNMAGQIEMTNLSLAEQEAMAKVGLIQDTSGKMVSLAYQQAALEGTLGEANLQAAQKKTALEEATGAKKEQLGMTKAQVAETQGAKKEGVAQMGMGIAEKVGAGAEQVAAQKAQIGTNVEQQKAGMAQQIGMGIPASQIGIGMDVASFTNALKQQGIANAGTMLNAPMGTASLLSQEAMAQPTTTTTKEGSLGGAILGGIGTLAGGAGSIMGGIGSMNTGSYLGSLFGKGATAGTGGSISSGGFNLGNFASKL